MEREVLEEGPAVSVVVPAYNERGSLEELVGETGAALERVPHEILIVDDGSTDGTWEVVLDLAERFDRVRGVRLSSNQGKAAALAAGFADCRGGRVVTIDADLQDDPSEIPGMLAMMDSKDLDLVSGWKRRRKDPLGKRVLSRVFNGVVRATTGVGLHDFNCGLKAYRRAVVENLDLYGEMHRYTPVLAAQRGFRVGETRVNHRPRRHGESKYGAERIFRGFSDLVTVLFLGRYSFRPLHFFGGIGTLMALAGFVISVYLTVLRITGESIGRRPLLLMGVLLLVVGFQLVSIGLLGEMLLRYSGRAPYIVAERTEDRPLRR